MNLVFRSGYGGRNAFFIFCVVVNFNPCVLARCHLLCEYMHVERVGCQERFSIFENRLTLNNINLWKNRCKDKDNKFLFNMHLSKVTTTLNC